MVSHKNWQKKNPYAKQTMPWKLTNRKTRELAHKIKGISLLETKKKQNYNWVFSSQVYHKQNKLCKLHNLCKFSLIIEYNKSSQFI